MTDTSMDFANGLAHELRIAGNPCEVKFLDKGCSSDRKYVVRSADEKDYLLRINDIEEQTEMREHFHAACTLWREGIACPKPILFDTDDERSICFMLQTYIQGDCAQEILPTMAEDLQYKVGLQVGWELRKMHEKPSPPYSVNNWSIRRKEYREHREFLEQSGIKFRGQDRAAKYVKKHMQLLRNRPTAFCHGDYHPGNVVLQDGELAGIIDFQCASWGDPLYDFYKVALVAPLSLPYARGQVTGYFDGDPPDGFWELYNFYVALMLFADVTWNVICSPEILDGTIELVELVGDMHEFETAGPPYWWTATS